MLENLVFGYVDKDEVIKYGEDVFINMIKSLQFISEYLIYTQEYIGHLCVEVDSKYKTLNSKYK
jgi:hypothetical protein